MSKKNKLIPFYVPKVLYENKYCNQEGFSILICGGKNKNGKNTNEVLELEIPSFKLFKFPSMVEPHCYLELISIKSDIIAIGDRVKSLDVLLRSVEFYSQETKSWTHHYLLIDKKI